MVDVRAPKYTSIAVMCYILQLYLARVSTVFTSTFGIFFRQCWLEQETACHLNYSYINTLIIREHSVTISAQDINGARIKEVNWAIL